MVFSFEIVCRTEANKNEDAERSFPKPRRLLWQLSEPNCSSSLGNLAEIA